MDTRTLYVAVARQLEADACAAEEAKQPRPFDPSERTAFRCGFYRGLQADVHRAGADAWERAAATLSRSGNLPPHPGAT